MSANLPESRKSSSAAKRFGKLSVLLIAAIFCTGFVLYAIEKSGYKTNFSLKTNVNKPGKSFKKQTVAAPKKLHQAGFDAPPTLSYSSKNNIFNKNIAVSLTPASAGVDAPAPGVYSSPTVLGSGITFAQNGIATDAAGNIYVCDIVGTDGMVKKITADGASTTIIGTGFLSQSSNVAVDQDGNVYVADQSVVWKIPVGSTPGTYDTPAVINNTFSRPFGIAADATGNIYVTDLTTRGVYKMTALEIIKFR